ncbi:MAG: hypothetical protein ACRC3Z_09670 [Phocaeicola sp.]
MSEQNKEPFKKFIESKYKPYGSSTKMVFRSTRELVYDCREMCEPTLNDVYVVMTELGYKSDQFCGQYTWALYEIEDPIY